MLARHAGTPGFRQEGGGRGLGEGGIGARPSNALGEIAFNGVQLSGTGAGVVY